MQQPSAAAREHLEHRGDDPRRIAPELEHVKHLEPVAHRFQPVAQQPSSGGGDGDRDRLPGVESGPDEARHAFDVVVIVVVEERLMGQRVVGCSP